MILININSNSHSSENSNHAPETTLAHLPRTAHHCPQMTQRSAVSDIDLNGKLLIAMPSMSDPRFAQSVVFVCAFSNEGAMGLIINKPSGDLHLHDLLDQLDIKRKPTTLNAAVHFGGPVEHGRGFVLHDCNHKSSISTLDVDGRFGMTATLDILEDIANGCGPRHSLIALGYAGWGPGQLEAEIADNAWLTVDADEDLVFRANDTSKWEAALNKLGVSSVALSSEAGHA